MSQYKIRSRPFNDERLPYSGRSLAANRKTEPEWLGFKSGFRTLTASGLKAIRSLRTHEPGMLAQMSGHRVEGFSVLKIYAFLRRKVNLGYTLCLK